ncbi:ribosome biogenesis protein Nop53/GLTSCR2 [Lineolata rhizophorae]|uniref:Ribosome biogenesis protein NOP53 n=1 Tax=Lineolata rhizophorae TaxID=578093 RepID=A0A6A6P559_9PEZI|nr:ribosome biogenesis protein Nop53/GLTSCR2 [Lineolata rhizophorae]
MATSIDAPQQHKQPSRKGKKAWRKHVDLTEVQAGLENSREEIIKHGAPLSTIPSGALFTTDTSGSDHIRRIYVPKKRLKADEILAQRSAVPALGGRKRPADGKVTDGILPEKRRRGGEKFVTDKEVARLKNLAWSGQGVTQPSQLRSEDSAAYDPWAEDDAGSADRAAGDAAAVERDAASTPAGEQGDAFSSFAPPKPKPVRAPPTLRHPPVSQTASGSAPRAVPRPDPGRSYNPDFNDWAALVERAGEREVAVERERLTKEAAEREWEERVKLAGEEAERLEKEVREREERGSDGEENWASEWESEWEGCVSGKEDDGGQEEEDGMSKKAKQPKRKTKAERNRAKRRKDEERMRAGEEKAKRREAQAARAKELAREAEQREKERQMRDLVLKDEGSEDVDSNELKLRKKTFGKHGIAEPNLELVLADELQDSLRKLKPEGNLLKDRFRHMLVSGKVEPRRPITQYKKPNRTLTEKWSYKDWKLV